jgi:oxygen-independent coproporphyrinogen-3 oxidase
MSFQRTHLYVHIPFCDGKCDYCGFFSVPYSREQGEAYLHAVVAELEQVLAGGGTSCPADTIYIGGGTPSVLEPDLFEQLLCTIREHLPVGRETEWTCEASPGSIMPEWLDVATAHGVNRISLGIQALDDSILQSVGRRHSVEDSFRAIDDIRSAGIENLGLDLIAGLPGVDAGHWQAALQQAVALAPQHLSVYALSIEPGTRLQRRIRAGRINIPGVDAQLLALNAAEDTLVEHGYERYEISNYAYPGFACRHNVACWRGEDYLAVGPAAASRNGLFRCTNHADLDAYIRALGKDGSPPRDETVLSLEDDSAERLVFRLRLAEGLDIQALRAANVTVSDWDSTLARLGGDGLIKREEDYWCLTSRGRNLCDYVIRELLPSCV